LERKKLKRIFRVSCGRNVIGIIKIYIKSVEIFSGHYPGKISHHHVEFVFLYVPDFVKAWKVTQICLSSSHFMEGKI